MFAAQRGVVFDPVARGNFPDAVRGFRPAVVDSERRGRENGTKGEAVAILALCGGDFHAVVARDGLVGRFRGRDRGRCGDGDRNGIDVGGLSDLPCRLAQGQTGAGLHGVGQRLDRLRISVPGRRDLVPVAGARQRVLDGREVSAVVRIHRCARRIAVGAGGEPACVRSVETATRARPVDRSGGGVAAARGRFADYVCHIRRAVRTDENNGRSAEYRPLP